MNILKTITDKALRKYNNSKYHVQTSESSFHTGIYLNTDQIISDPGLVEEIVKTFFIKKLNELNIKPNRIITYPPFGLVIAYSIAKQIGAKFGYIDTKMNICNFDIKNGEKVIIVGDDIYSGESLRKTIEIVSKMSAKIEAPLLTIGNFSGSNEISGISIYSIITKENKLYSKGPMCKNGSKAVLPRINWKELMSNHQKQPNNIVN